MASNVERVIVLDMLPLQLDEYNCDDIDQKVGAEEGRRKERRGGA